MVKIKGSFLQLHIPGTSETRRITRVEQYALKYI